VRAKQAGHFRWLMGRGNRSVVCRLAGRVKRRNRKRKKHVICSSEVVAIVSICGLAHYKACVVLGGERRGSAAGSRGQGHR
jgi:hypothetical protein